MKAPPMVPDALERLKASGVISMPEAAKVTKVLIEHAHRDGYAAGFAAALAMLREPDGDLLKSACFADCRRNCTECDTECRLYEDNLDGESMRVALRAVASALADSAGREGE